MPDWLTLYHHMPYPLRVVMASTRGYYLRRWRYGREIEKIVAHTLEKDYWTPEQWQSWQEEKLAMTLHHAATQVPYYRNYWQKRRSQGDRASWEILYNWPVLHKEDVRQYSHLLIAEDHNKKRLFTNSTSGTTGTPLKIFLSREAVQSWYGIFEARVRRWSSLSHQDRWAILGGQLVVPFKQQKPPFWVHNLGLKQLYLSSHHLSYKNAAAYVEAICQYKPNYMIVYPSSAQILAQAILEQGLKVGAMKAVFSNAEMLLESQRYLMERAFATSVVNTYGMGEHLFGASECQFGKMHIWPEVGVLEVLQRFSNEAVSMGEVGRFVMTGLLNNAMPLIRYEIGDQGQLAATDCRCECGRLLPILPPIEGRLNDLLVTRDGRFVFWVNPIFYNLPLREAQIIQESLEQLRICYVPAPGFTDDVKNIIKTRLVDRMGAIHIVFEAVPMVPRTTNGKFQAVVSHISPEERPGRSTASTYD